MAVKLKKNSDTLASNRFTPKNGGYNAFEVDSLLDEIIADYEKVENNVLISKTEYEQLNKRIEELEKQNIELKIKFDKANSKWKYLITDDKKVHIDNLELLIRIGKLEKIIHDKLHLNPDEINTFDPDDC